jgi:hypothetical protein
MEVWLVTFDRAVRCLQNTDKPGDLAKLLNGSPFPVDWIPEDGSTLAACPALYHSCSGSIPEACRATAGETGKSKPRNRSLLMIAAKFGRLDCVKSLVGPPFYASPLLASKFDGNTPLHVAVTYGKVEVAKFLLHVIGSGARLLTNK